MGILLSRGAILTFQEGAPHRRIHAKRRKEVCAHRRMRDSDRSILPLEKVEVPGASFHVVERDARKRVATRLPLRNVQVRIAPSPLAVLVNFCDLHQRTRIPVRQRPQQHPVHHGVHRHRRSQSQCQRHHHRHRKSRCASQLPQRIPHILQHAFQPHAAPHLARHILDQRNIPQLTRGIATRLFFRFAALHAIRDRHLQMCAQLLAELVSLLCKTYPLCKPRLGQPHASLPSGSRCIIAATASTICCQRPRSRLNCFLPAAVMR